MPKGNSIKQFLERVGGQFNASTSFDRTNYFATIGRESLENYVAIEADRMRHLWLHEGDRQSEMTVVRNEFERGKNDPEQCALCGRGDGGSLRGAAIPSPDDRLEQRHRARAHRQVARLLADTFYWPNNATVTLVGEDVEPAAALALEKKYYGAYPHSPAPIPLIYTEEPRAKRRTPRSNQAPR